MSETIQPVPHKFGPNNSGPNNSVADNRHKTQIPSLNRLCSKAGFTMIEIMIVIGIIAAVIAIGAPKLFNPANQMRSDVRKLAVMTRDMRNIARLYNSTTRLVLTMDDEEGHSYSVESAPGNVTLMNEEQKKELEQMTSMQRDDDAPKSEFAPEPRVLKKPVQLTRGLYFDTIEYGSNNEEISGGIAHIHFFPQGLAEETAIHLSDRKTMHWTIMINPLTGRADVFERKVMLKELRGP